MITTSGLPPPVIADCPRIRILEEPAGPVPSEEILTPATFPCSAFNGLAVLLTVSSSGFTLEAEYPRLLACLLIPNAVITTASRLCALVNNVTFTTERPETGTSMAA